jgi:DNA invertase Pin-like site-specific DNA recombinase
LKTIGYARVSSLSQSLDVQIEQLKAAGCDKLFAEKRSGTSRQGREALAEALDYAREGDTLVVTRLDRLARSAADLHVIVSQLNAKGVGFRCLQQGSVDTTTSMGKLTLGILGAVAEFETDIRRERQKEGIEKAKEAGVYKGRPASIDSAKIRELHSSGVGPSEIAKRLRIGRASVYRLLKGPT